MTYDTRRPPKSAKRPRFRIIIKPSFAVLVRFPRWKLPLPRGAAHEADNPRNFVPWCLGAGSFNADGESRWNCGGEHRRKEWIGKGAYRGTKTFGIACVQGGSRDWNLEYTGFVPLGAGFVFKPRIAGRIEIKMERWMRSCRSLCILFSFIITSNLRS